MKVYGASVSYYTGKLEAYLRYKRIAYTRLSPYAEAKRIEAEVGCIQHPMVERDDGRWMSDTTPMIQQLEREHPASPVIPANPVTRFIALLIEDYADEWLWRCAMHYRWSYEHDRELLSRILTDELTAHLKAPRFIRRNMIKNRQRKGFVINDGVTDANREHVEQGYANALDCMSTILRKQPFLLGNAPSIADFGMMGPMLRHFGQDPTPAEIMRDNAPLVLEWLARTWNASPPSTEINFVLSDALQPLMQEVVETHLEQLKANAEAYGQNQKKFSMTIQGASYSNLPVSRYRVYCLEMLREEFTKLSTDEQRTVQSLLPWQEAEILWQGDEVASSGYDTAREAPFNKAINVFENGVPS